MKSTPSLIAALLGLTTIPLMAANAPGTQDEISKRTKAIGIPRLLTLAATQPEQVHVYDLSDASAAQGVAVLKRQTGISYVEVPPNSSWTKEVGANGVVYVTFTLQVSPGSSVTVGGARINFVRGQRDGYVGMNYVDGVSGETQAINHEIPLRPLGNTRLAALATGTIMLDPNRGRWTLFKGYRPVLYDIAIPSSEKFGSAFSVAGGEGGAWLSGLVISRINPLFDDANTNGIDDSFERQEMKRLASVGSESSGLYPKWKDDLRRRPIEPIRIVLPGPSGLSTKSKPQP